jgi:aminomethyltransferase
VPVWLARTGYTGEDGFELYVDADRAEPLWEALYDAGADRRGRAGRAWHAGTPCVWRRGCRCTAGTQPSERTPFDAGLGRIVALSSSRGFVGRDAAGGRRKPARPSSW